MTTEQYRKTNAGRPIIFRIAHQRGVPGTAADTDFVISDKGEGQFERYALHYQRLDDGSTYSGVYSDNLADLIMRAVGATQHRPIYEAFETATLTEKTNG